MRGQLLAHFRRRAGELEPGFHAEHDLPRLRRDELHANAVAQQALEQAQRVGRAGGAGHCQRDGCRFHGPEEMAFSASTSLSVACDRRAIRFSRKMR